MSSMPKSILPRVTRLLLVCSLAAAGFAPVAGRERGPVSIVFGGDVMLDNGPGHAITYGQDPFAEFAEMFQAADISVCNLECTLADGGKQALKAYTFLARPACATILKRYFTAVNLANNHALDYGRDGFLQELSLLEKAGVGYFGGGRDRQAARRPLVLERKGLRVALLGYNEIGPRAFVAGKRSPGTTWLEEADVVADIRRARSQEQADIVIPYLHWGYEMVPSPEPDQQLLARHLIDAGASAVVGAHPHVTQTVDYYRGRPIIYSLGNFVFDYYPGDPAIWTGWLVRLTCSKSGHVDLQTFALQIDAIGMPHPCPRPGRSDSIFTP
jgi:poly-gamma-glutamate capsule biosynthesis protein CapA/YwtB (metallophosphatase superfamily)